MRSMDVRSVVLACAVLFAADAAQARAQSTPSPAPSATPNPWQFRVTPYVWLPAINASLRFESSDISVPAGVPPAGAFVTVGPNDYLKNLNSAFMFTADARKGNGGFFTDFIYLNMSSAKNSVAQIVSPDGNVVTPVNVSTNAHVRSTVWTLALSASPFSTSNPPPLEGFVGFRYLSTSASADWTLTGSIGQIPPVGSANTSVTEVLPIAGFKGRLGLGPHWFVPYYTDYGANGDLNTWQGLLGVAYAYHSGAAILAWRQLNYNANGQPSLIQYMHLGGPAVGWTFNL